MALGDKRREEAIRGAREEAGQQEVEPNAPVIKRTVVQTHTKRPSRKKKVPANFSLRPKEKAALAELTDLLDEKSDSELLGKLIMKAYKVAAAPDFNNHQTDIFDFL